MSKKIQVSIIIPVYNDELYLEESIRSAMAQSNIDLEILCINDGSTDGSDNILRRCAKEDTRIRIIYQENQGLSGARNTGIRAARGEYLFFLDADDRLKENAIQELYLHAITNEADIVSFDGFCFFQKPELYDQKREQYYTRKRAYGLMEGIQMFTEMRAAGDYCDSACLLLINKQWLEKAGITFYPEIYHEDCLFTLQCMLHSKRVLHVNQIFYERRIKEGSITTIPKTLKHLYGKMICHIHFCKFLYTENFTEQQANALAEFTRTMMREMREILAVLPEEEYQKLLSMPLTPVMRLSLEQAGVGWKETIQSTHQDEKNIAGKENVKMVNVEEIVHTLQEEIKQRKNEVKVQEHRDSGLLNKLENKEKVVIVGSGNFGVQCYQLICSSGDDKVICFADNGYEKYTCGLMGKKVISLEDAAEKYRDAHFVVTPKYHFMDIIRQLTGLKLPLEQIDCWLGY